MPRCNGDEIGLFEILDKLILSTGSDSGGGDGNHQQLGTEYKIIREEMKDAEYDGYCDYTSKIIKLRTDNVSKLGDFDCLMKKQLRHEIIHAFLYESGLGPNFEHYKQFGHEETIVDWFAIQFPKISADTSETYLLIKMFKQQRRILLENSFTI